MADKKKEPKTPEDKPANSSVISQGITAEMREAYLNYAMSVITSRALPDVRDGLKPVHRRILFAMRDIGLTYNGRPRKSATVVGEVLGKYHPHGDTAVYESMVKMTQPFVMRYPLVVGQGNFGSIDGDSAAAMRYTEAKMSAIAGEMLRDIEKETVTFSPNYDNTKMEPDVLPAAVPNLLMNGTLGIAVGMATNIPPHNLRELTQATIHIIEHPDATTEDLLSFVKGPDFPTGCIAFNQKDITHAYSTGRGGVVVRGESEIVEDKKGNYQIIITSIPYRVNKSDLIAKIADLVHTKKIEGIKDMRDESTTDIRIAIDLKSSANPQTVLNLLYKHTQLEDTFHFNMVALVDGVPYTLSLKALLEAFIAHRKDVTTKRARFELTRAEDREHILIGLKKALDHIDKIIATIKKSKDATTAHAALKTTFTFSDKQATAILEMRLQKLAGLERQKVEDELKEVQALIKELTALLKSETKLLGLIKEELAGHAEKYGDERRTKIVKGTAKVLSPEDLVTDEESVLVLTKGGYIKRTNPSEFKKQKRGGVGVIDLDTKDEDFVTTFLTTSTHSDLLFFTDRGKVYQLKMYEVPEGRRATKGKSVMNFLSLDAGEIITSVLPMPATVKKSERLSLMMVTKLGTIKKVVAEQFYDVRRSGLIAINLTKGDELISAQFVRTGDDVLLATARGQAIRFSENGARPMGRSAAGVRGIKMTAGDHVIGAGVIPKGEEKSLDVFVLSAKGFGKKTPVTQYKQQGRAGSGIKTVAVTEKTGELIGASIIGRAGEIVAMSQKGQVIRTGIEEIPKRSRQTQGVRIMKLRAGDKIAASVCLTTPQHI